MRAYSSTQPVYNPLSTPTNSRFAAALAAISEPCETLSDKGELHQPNSFIYQASGGHVLDKFLAYPPLPFNGDLPPTDIRLGPLQLHHPSATRKTAA